MNVFKLKVSKHSIAFLQKIGNPCRALKVIILTSGGQPGQVGGHRGAADPLPPL